jgi:hypothetical protein
LDVDSSDATLDGGTCTVPARNPDAGAAGSLNWAESFGGTGYTIGTCVAIDPSSGDVVTAGGLVGTVNFGGGLLVTRSDASTAYDTFVARFDKNGAYRWAKNLGNGQLVGPNSVAVDGSGNVVVAGLFQGSVSFGGPTLTAAGTFDAFVVEFDASGNFLWSRNFGVAGQSQNLNSVAVDSTGHVFIAGEARGGVSFGGAAVTGFFIAKFDSNGAHSWSNAFPATTSYGGPWLAVDGFGDVILAGSFETTVNFGGGTLTAGASDPFVAKFDSTGTYQWAKQFGDSVSQNISGVGTDLCGNIFVTGNFGGTIDFGSGPLIMFDTSVFLAKIDPLGTGVWSKAFPLKSGSTLNAGRVAVDGTGGPTAAYGLIGSVDFGGGPITSGGGFAALASFDAAGGYRWSYAAGPDSTAISDIGGLASSGATVVVIGSFLPQIGSSGPRTLVLGGKTLTTVSKRDTYLASFSP